MIIVILALGLILFSVIDRFLYKFNEKEKLKSITAIVIIVRVIMLICFFTMIYYVTDTGFDFFIVGLTFSLYFLLNVIYNKRLDELRWNLIVIIGTPLFAFLLILTTQHLLINISYMLLPVLIPATIIASPYKEELSRRSSISKVLGIGITIILLLSFNSIYDGKVVKKQETFAKEYIINELNLDVDIIYSNGKLRGEDTEVKAYTSDDTKIALIYRDNSIVSYEIKKLDER